MLDFPPGQKAPAKMKANWSIFCPGPSLNHRHDTEDNRGCSIAVNGALLKQEADYWAMLDPAVFHKVINDQSTTLPLDRITLWIPENFAILGLQKGKGRGNWTVFSCRTYELMKKKFFDSIFFERTMFSTRIPWIAYTKFTAVALAILEGAKVINLYGDDMRGYGYFKNGLTNELTIHTDDRWYDERSWTDLLIQECMSRNIEIRRMFNDGAD